MCGLFLFESVNDFHFIAIDQCDNNVIQIREALIAEFEKISVENENELKCQLNEGHSFTISFSDECLRRFLYLRQVLLENYFMLPLFYTIIHFVRQDDKLLAEEEFEHDLYLKYFVKYCIKNKFIREPSASSLLDGLNVEPNKFSTWCQVYDSLTNVHTELTGRILLNFYRDNAFKLDDEETNAYFAPNSIDLLRTHFYNVFNLISNSIDIASIWDWVIAVEVELKPCRHSLNYIERCCRSPCLYAKDAFLLLFTNLKSMLDLIKFDLYAGSKFIKHYKKECYVPKLACDNKETSSDHCFAQFYTHSLDQFTKAREYSLRQANKGQSSLFLFQLKFGNFYLTNIAPSLLTNSNKMVSLFTLRNELTFNTYDFDVKQKNGFIRNSFSNLSLTSSERNGKRKLFQQNFSAFNSNINNDMDVLHSLLNDNGFEFDVATCFLVYLCTKDDKAKNSKSFRFKYNTEFELVSESLIFRINSIRA